MIRDKVAYDELDALQYQWQRQQLISPRRGFMENNQWYTCVFGVCRYKLSVNTRFAGTIQPEQLTLHHENWETKQSEIIGVEANLCDMSHSKVHMYLAMYCSDVNHLDTEKLDVVVAI